MASLRECSHQGKALRFSDGVTQVAHPGILIESMDFEELAAWLCICNSCSNHPCPQCLVHHDDLHRLTCSYPPRTTETMCKALSQAPTSSRTARNAFLKGYGMHDFEHFLWTFAHSDPYEAAGYDCLLDGGIWGHHMWHESSPTTIDFSDGQTFLDILKDVSQKHNKSLDFLKQHFLSHAIDNFRAKGTSKNMNTRVREGFQQEVSAQYTKTNGKNAEHQIPIMDEREEAMARIQMAVDAWLESQAEDEKTRTLEIKPCKVLYIDFQSRVDWKAARDILRCNPNFHNPQDDDLAMGRLESLFRCHLPRKVTVDLVMIRLYRSTSWTPWTRTDCPMRKWGAGAVFVALEHVTRRALLCPIFGAPCKVFYIVDCIDEDMFLRVNGID
ncbi:hypothetical protein B0H10DRAFT_2161973 [Mycena sp. CBHHK59/15]|nr:hypothetical protein B0H10DRAFT_2161973 [Mycena sp. CBHHK59/15]